MSNEDFKPESVECSYTQRIESDPETIFPLLCPEMEKLWLHGWDYKMVWSKSGVAEKDCIFITETEHEGDTCWVNTIRDFENLLVEFVIFTPFLRVTTLKINIEPESDHCRVKISYISTSLSEKGNMFLKEYFSEELFDSRMKWWENSMNFYIVNGKMYKGDSESS